MSDGHTHHDEHEHAHEHGTEPVLEDAVLDIGGDIGALVLITGPELVGHEVEVSRIDKPEARIHTVVHERRVGERVVFAGVFVELRAGTYRIWAAPPGLIDGVTIIGGEVAEVDWTP